MALSRLQNTEKRLLKSNEIAEVYQKIIKDYLKKEYIEKIHTGTNFSQEIKESDGWLLPHFPVLRPEKATTKTRIVFDASAKYEGLSLNDFIHCGPELQNELTDVLLRFRKEPVALMCDISEMYLQIGIAQNDRQYHRMLWRDLDTARQPDIHQFKRVVFGVNSSPFMALYVAQHQFSKQ